MERWKRVDTCDECDGCEDHKLCLPIKTKLRSYKGTRPTSDGFDCALPFCIDSHSVCAYGCLYCFADNLIEHRAMKGFSIGQTSLREVEAVFSGGGGQKAELYREMLKYNQKVNGYPCPVQLGALNDPCDAIERQQGWLLDFMGLAVKYRQPVRISTKGDLFLIKEYLDAISKAPELFWVAFSIITPDDDLIRRIDRRAPVTSERLQCMKNLSKRGVKTSLRFRPILPGVSDATPKYPKAYKVLIEKSKEVGAVAISYETGFTPGCATSDIKAKWNLMSRITGVPYLDLYKTFGKNQACTRPSYFWIEDIMHAIYEEAKKCGLTVGVSDPVWKQLTETGCCCGILPDDPVFGNWQRESATNRLLEAKNNGQKEIRLQDIIPAWAEKVIAGDDMVAPGVGPGVAYKRRHWTWVDVLTELWNNPGKERSPLNYFQGALKPKRRDKEGNLVYEYVGLKRQFLDNVPFWRV